MLLRTAAVLLFVGCAAATTFFKEDFSDETWKDRWVMSTKKGSGQGKFDWSSGELNAGTDAEKGLMATEDMKHYTASAKFAPFSNKDKTLVLQYTAKLPKKFECGGAYLKLHPKGLDQTSYDGESEYNIMFGPDHCGYSTKKIHCIFNYKGKNLEKKEEVKLEHNEKDELTHLYTLIVKPDNTFEIRFDQTKKVAGNLIDHWDFLKPKEIDDPSDKKPEDWEDEAKIPDPTDKKPDNYDSIPKQIQDPDAKKPEAWDDDTDGDWEAPMIDNPEYKGEWKPKMIDNPKYKGVWKARKIPNPDFVDDPNVYLYSSIESVGIEVWNVNSGVVYDNIIVTDSIDEANDFAEKTWKPLVEKEKKVKADLEQKEKKEAPAAAAKKEEDDEESDSDDEEEDKKEEKKDTKKKKEKVEL